MAGLETLRHPLSHETIPVTAMIGSHNEASLLHRCLRSVAFCDEVIVIDIDSTDGTAQVAEELGARVIRHSWVPIAERARLDLVDEAKHDWLLFLDPDEVFPERLAEQVAELLPTVEPDVAVIDCPWQFYFRRRPLRGTTWGGVTRKRMLARRGVAELRPTVHSGTRVGPVGRAHVIEYSGDNAIAHYWAPGYRALIAKHWRYLKLEGGDRHSAGMVTGYRDIARTPWSSFYESFVRKHGFRDGGTGLALSVLWSAYSTGAKLALLLEARRARDKGGADAAEY